MELLEWMTEGKCLSIDPRRKRDFFADRDNEKAQKRAKAVCAECIVKDICLEHAIEQREPFIWGGTTEEERGFVRTRSFLKAWREDASRHNKPHEPERPTYACSSYPSNTSSQQNHIQPVLQTTVGYEPPSLTHVPSSVMPRLLEGQSYHHNQSSLSEPCLDSPKILQLLQFDSAQCEEPSPVGSHQSIDQYPKESSSDLLKKSERIRLSFLDQIPLLQFHQAS